MGSPSLPGLGSQYRHQESQQGSLKQEQGGPPWRPPGAGQTGPSQELCRQMQPCELPSSGCCSKDTSSHPAQTYSGVGLTTVQPRTWFLMLLTHTHTHTHTFIQQETKKNSEHRKPVCLLSSLSPLRKPPAGDRKEVLPREVQSPLMTYYLAFLFPSRALSCQPASFCILTTALPLSVSFSLICKEAAGRWRVSAVSPQGSV